MMTCVFAAARRVGLWRCESGATVSSEPSSSEALLFGVTAKILTE